MLGHISGRVNWTEEQKEALRPLIQQLFKEKKPPRKTDVEQVQKKYLCLQGLKWLSIKYYVWSVIQSRTAIARKIVG